MFLHHNLKRNNKGIGTVFGMVFFLLIVMAVFASFIVVLSQNTGFEHTTVQAKQLDLDRYAELQTVSVANPETAVNKQLVYISCTITNNGTLPTELVRLWIRDITQNTTGNTELSPSIMLQPGSSINYFNFSYVANSEIYDQFSFWFITTRGNLISAYPDINQFKGLVTDSTFPGVTDINSTYSGDQTPLRLYLNTTKPNQLIYVIVSYDDENTLYTPTSTPSLTWTRRSQSLDTDYGIMDGDSTLETYYAIMPSVGPLQINIQSTADELSDYYCSALAFAVSDVNTTSPFDGSAQTTVGKSTFIQDTITTHYSNELIIGALSIDSLNPVINPGPGFAEIMPVQSSYGASGEPDAQPRSVWSEWEILDAPRNNFSANCTFTSTKNWAIVVDAVKLVVTPPTAPVSLYPTNGPIGQPVTVAGQGFAANSQLIATFDGKQVPFSYSTDASGNIPSGATFAVPAGSSPGNKTVTIIDSKFNYASANFAVVTPTVSVTPHNGTVGTSVAVTGSNFISNSAISINLGGNSIATNPSTITTNNFGAFSAIFAANGTAGVKQVFVVDGVNSVYDSFTIIPSTSISPSRGVDRDQVLLSGLGFAANSNLNVTFDGVLVLPPPENATTDATGSFSNLIFNPHSTTPGLKNITVTDESNNSATTTYNLMLVPVAQAPTLNPGSSITLGNSATASVTVSGVTGFTPTGTLTFQYSTDNGLTWTNQSALKTLSGGSATSDSLTPQSAGSNYLFRAIYNGDSNYVGATGASGTLTVNKGAAVVGVASFVPASPITLGSSVSVSASVSAPSGITTAPTGNVQFQVSINSGAYSNFGSVVALSSGSASITYTPSAIGTYSFQATYQGDNNYISGTNGNPSGTLTVYIPSSTSTMLSSSSPITLGSTVTDTATVTPQTNMYNTVTYVSSGAGVSGTGGSLNVAYPASFAANDLFLVQVTIRDTTNLPTMPSGWNLLYGPDSTGTGRQWIYYKFATGAESGTISTTFGGSNLKIARIYDFRNVAPTSFTEGTSFGFNAGSSTILAQSVTTIDVNRLAVSFVFDTYSNSLSSFSGSLGGTWTEPVLEYTTTTSSRGGVQLQTAVMPSAGTISGGSTNIVTSASWGVRAFALIPSPATASGNINFQVLPPSGSWTTYNTQALSFGAATSTSFKPTDAGTWYFRAVYAGDANYVGSQSVDDAEPLIVNSVGATIGTTTYVPASPSGLGTSETVSVTISGPSGVTAPSGNVQFQVSVNGGSYSDFGSPVTLSAGSATISYLPQTLGTYQFQPVYSGDSNYISATGAASSILTVNRGNAVVGASSFVPAGPIALGGSVSVSASVSAPSGITSAPTGNVQFQVKIGAGSYANFGSPVALSGGLASISYTPGTVNTYSFQAVYQGDSNYNTGTIGAASGTLTVTNQVTFVASGTGIGFTSTNAQTVNYPAGWAAGDLIMLQITVRDATSGITTAPSGFTLLYGPDSNTVGRQWIYYRFAVGSDTPSVSIAIAGAQCKVARMYAFRNVAASSFTEGDTNNFGFNAGSTTVSAQSVATTGIGRLAVAFVFTTYSNTVPAFSGSTGGTWTVSDTGFTTNSDSRGSVQLETAIMGSGGTISGGTCTIGTSTSWGVRALALKPA
jgi:hypothetical protein